MIKTIYVAATGQHKGKTTSTLGIVASLQKEGYKVGYCKPVGQKFLTVNGKTADKDAVLFAQSLHFDVIPEIHSPVVLGSGITAKFIDDPTPYNFKERLLKANDYLNKTCDIVVHEGTGHPGVGSVVGLSNADVAKILNAGVIMVAEGGIGNTIDRLNMSLALFRERNVPILGVIINKVKVDKLEHVSHYLEKKLTQMGIPYLGSIPYDRRLSFPIMSTVCKAVKGKIMFGEMNLDSRVEHIVAASLLDADGLESFQNILLVVSNKRFHHAIRKIKKIEAERKLEKCPLAGVVITGDGRHATWYREEDLRNEYLIRNNIPVLTTSLDTFGSVVKISRIEVKINTHTPWKVNRAIELIQKHIDIKKVLDQI